MFVVVGYGFECAADLVDVFVAAAAVCIFFQMYNNKIIWGNGIDDLFQMKCSAVVDLHERGCNDVNWRHNAGRIRHLHCIRVFEDAMWFPTAGWFLFPIALYLITGLLNDHMTFGTIRLKTLTFCPFRTDTFVT